MTVGSCLLRCYTDNEISVRERAKLAWTPVIFLRLWKIWISCKQYDSKTHFISDQTYTDTILAGHSLILNMLIFSKYYPDVPFCPSFFGSDACEVLFSYLRGFTRGKNNFNFLEMLDITARTVKLLELKYKGRRLKSKRNHSAWLSNLEKMIIEGIKDAEREVLKTVEEMGMVPGLREANITPLLRRTFPKRTFFRTN